MSERRALQLIVLLTVLGLVLRVVALDAESAWTDEMFSMRMAHASLGDLLSGAVRDRGNPSGYYLLLHGWLHLFGDSLGSARLLSALSGACAVPLTAILARRLAYPPVTAVVAAALVALSPPLVYLAREARVFPLATCLVLVHLVAVTTIMRAPRLRAWLLYVVSAALLLYLHYFSVFVLVAAGGWLLVRGPRPRWPLFVAAGAVVLLFAPYLPTLAWQVSTGMERSAETWWKHALFMPAFVVVGHTLVWIEQGIVWVGLVLAATLALVWAPVGWTLRQRVPWLLVVTGLGPIVLAGLFSLVAPLLLGRYASVVFPALLVLVAVALQYATKRLRIVLAASLTALTLASLIGLYALPHKDDWRALGATLDGRRALYAVPAEAAQAIAFYRPDLRPTVLDPRDIDAATLAARLSADHGDAWLVLYRYDPRVGASTERALAALPEVHVETVIGERRLALLHLTTR